MLCILTSSDPTGSSSRCEKILEKGHFQNTASRTACPRKIAVCTHHKNPWEYLQIIPLNSAEQYICVKQARWVRSEGERLSKVYAVPQPCSRSFQCFPKVLAIIRLREIESKWLETGQLNSVHKSYTAQRPKATLDPNWITGKREAVFSMFLKCKISE